VPSVELKQNTHRLGDHAVPWDIVSCHRDTAHSSNTTRRIDRMRLACAYVLMIWPNAGRPHLGVLTVADCSCCAQGSHNLLFVLTGAGKLNFAGTKQWLQNTDMRLLESVTTPAPPMHPPPAPIVYSRTARWPSVLVHQCSAQQREL
jgi:hypothetical protein